MDEGPEAIGDDAELRTVREQAARVRRRAAVLAPVLTAAAWVLPA